MAKKLIIEVNTRTNRKVERELDYYEIERDLNRIGFDLETIDNFDPSFSQLMNENGLHSIIRA